MNINVIDMSEIEFKPSVHRPNCKHLSTHIQQIHGVWWNGEQSNEVVDELLVCDSCKDIILRLSEERNNEVDYDYTR